jgi:hypothetical protein
MAISQVSAIRGDQLCKFLVVPRPDIDSSPVVPDDLTQPTPLNALARIPNEGKASSENRSSYRIRPLFWVGFVFIQSSRTVHPQCIDIATGLKENGCVKKLEAANSWLRGE